MRIAIVCPPPASDLTPESKCVRAENETRSTAGHLRSVLHGAGARKDLKSEWISPENLRPGSMVAADAMVVGLPVLPRAAPPWLDRIPQALPKVVVVPDPPTAALLLRRHRVDQFVAEERIEDDLSPALREAYGSTTLARAMSVVRNRDGLSATLRSWMLQVLTAVPPYSGVKESAKSPAAVRKARERVIGTSGPKEFLRWILVVRATALKQPHVAWRRIAPDLDVSSGILNRAVERTTGLDMAAPNGDSAEQVRNRFEEYLVRVLVSG